MYKENLMIKSYEFIQKKMIMDFVGGPILISLGKVLKKGISSDACDGTLEVIKEGLKILRFVHQLLASSKIRLPLVFHNN